MRWRRRHDWPDRPARPKVRRLSAEEQDEYLKAMVRAIDRSPVLSGLHFEVHALRGRLYIYREGRWGAFTIRPSESDSITSAERWLEMRKWRPWT